MLAVGQRVDLEVLKQRADIVSVISRYVELDRRGWARCPFHAERTPSFHVLPEKQIAHCFGACGETWDVIAFVRRAEGCDFSEAVRRLGGDLPGAAPVRLPPPLPPAPKPPRAWQTDPERWVREFVSAGDSAPLWQAYRPLSEETITLWQLGVGRLPSSKCAHRRLTVPVRRDGRIVALAGRAFECPPDCEAAKWTLSGGSEFALFNLDGVTEGSTVIVVENRADAILACQEWSDYVTVAKGSANVWRPEWTERLVAVRPALIRFWPDNDEAGYLGAARGANELLKAGLRAEVMRWDPTYPPKYDLGAFLMTLLSEFRCA